MTDWTTAYLGLGANLGDREESILSALRELGALPTIRVEAVSSLYETAPVGLTDQPDFLNAVAQVETTLAPEGLLHTLLALEKSRGRVRTRRWGPRVIDIDILTYGQAQVNTPALTLPHPRLTERAFVLIPLAEIAPHLVLPGETEPVEKKSRRLRENGNIWGRRVVQKDARPRTPNDGYETSG